MLAEPQLPVSISLAPIQKPSGSQMMPDIMGVVKRSSTPTKRSATPNPISPTKASTNKRKKEAPVHPRLPKIQSTEIDDINEIKLEGVVSKVKRLGLPVDRSAIEKALTESDASLDRYLGYLQAQQAAALVQKKQAQAVQLPPSPTSSVSKEVVPPTPTSLTASLPSITFVLSVDGSGRAAVLPAEEAAAAAASSTGHHGGSFGRRFVPRTQVVAAEIDGMGRVVLERSVLVDRLGPNGAAVAEARARGSVAPPLITQTITPPPSLSGNLPFGFGIKSSSTAGRPLPLASVPQDVESTEERNERIAAWLNTPDEEDEMEVEESLSAPVSMAPTGWEEVKAMAPGRGKSTVRLSQASHRFQPSSAELAQTSPARQAAVSWPATMPKESIAEDGVIDCLCHRGEEEEGDLVQCERCRSWFHLGCVDLTHASLPEHWSCVRCTGGEMPVAWRSRQQSVHGTPLREAPIFSESALTPRVGHFTNSFLSSELALAPSPAVGRADGRRVRISAEYSPRSPSRSSISYGARRRLQSGTFEDPLPLFDDEDLQQRAPVWPVPTEFDTVEPPAPVGPGSMFPSTPSRYAYTSSDGLSHQVTPASTMDSARSRSSSAAGTRFSFPSTPSSQEWLAHFDSASTTGRYNHLPSFSPVCEQSPLVQRHRRNRSSLSGPSYAFARANWAAGPPSSSAGLIKAMMSGPPSEVTDLARSESGLGIGFEAGPELVQQMDF